MTKLHPRNYSPAQRRAKLAHFNKQHGYAPTVTEARILSLFIGNSLLNYTDPANASMVDQQIEIEILDQVRNIPLVKGTPDWHQRSEAMLRHFKKLGSL